VIARVQQQCFGSLSLTPPLLENVGCGLVLKLFFAIGVCGAHVQGELWETDGLRFNGSSKQETIGFR